MQTAFAKKSKGSSYSFRTEQFNGSYESILSKMCEMYNQGYQDGLQAAQKKAAKVQSQVKETAKEELIATVRESLFNHFRIVFNSVQSALLEANKESSIIDAIAYINPDPNNTKVILTTAPKLFLNRTVKHKILDILHTVERAYDSPLSDHIYFSLIENNDLNFGAIISDGYIAVDTSDTTETTS